MGEGGRKSSVRASGLLFFLTRSPVSQPRRAFHAPARLPPPSRPPRNVRPLRRRYAGPRFDLRAARSNESGGRRRFVSQFTARVGDGGRAPLACDVRGCAVGARGRAGSPVAWPAVSPRSPRSRCWRKTESLAPPRTDGGAGQKRAGSRRKTDSHRGPLRNHHGARRCSASENAKVAARRWALRARDKREGAGVSVDR